MAKSIQSAVQVAAEFRQELARLDGAATEDVLLRLVMERRAGGSTAVEDAFRLLIDAGRLEVVEGVG